MIDNDCRLGDWWEPIESAPLDGTRLILAFPAVERERRLGERKQKGQWAKTGMVRHLARVTTGLYVAGTWAPGKKSPQPYFDQPTHWMHLPELPEEYANLEQNVA